MLIFSKVMTDGLNKRKLLLNKKTGFGLVL